MKTLNFNEKMSALQTQLKELESQKQEIEKLVSRYGHLENRFALMTHQSERIETLNKNLDKNYNPEKTGVVKSQELILVNKKICLNVSYYPKYEKTYQIPVENIKVFEAIEKTENLLK
jgi:hypothetical protein